MSKSNSEMISNENMYEVIRKNSYYLLMERVVVPLINFLVFIYIIRKLTVDEFGIYNILFAVMAYISLISSLGLPNIFQRFIPEFFQNREIGKLKKLVEQGLLWWFVVSLGFILIVLLFSEQIGELLKFSEALRYLAIFSFAIIFNLESGLLSTTLTSVFHHKKYAIAQIAYVILRAALLYYMLDQGKGLVGVIISESAAFGFLFLIQIYFYRRFLASQPFEKKSDLPRKRLFRFGGYSYFNEVGAQILNVSTDFFVISAFLGPVAVGIYAFANRVMKLIGHILPHSVFMRIIRPTFFRKYTQDDDPAKINRMFNLLMKSVAFFTFPLIAGILVLADKLIIYVFDPKYLESLTVLWIVAIFIGLNFFQESIGLVLQSKEKVQILFYSKIFAIYNLVADILIVKIYGVLGIAVVTGSAVLFKNLFCYYYAKKHASVSMDFKGIGKVALNSVLMGSIVYPMRGMVNNLLSFVLVVFLGMLIYLFFAFVNKAFSSEERNIMNKILPRPVFSF